MEWNLCTGAILSRTNNSLRLFVDKITPESSEARPKGNEINSELAEGNLGRDVLAFLDSSDEGEIPVGSVRVGAGGGFRIPFEQIDLGTDRERIITNLEADGFSIPEEAFVAVIRGQTAPGTRGIDGGGAGIPAVHLDNPTRVRAQCIQENLEEVGIGNDEGRVGFNLPDSLKGFGIEEAVAHEWNESFGALAEVPWKTTVPVATYASLNILPAPDRLVVGNEWEVDNIVIAVETENSSVEFLQMHELVLPPGKYRFWDLERKKNGERLERLIAVVLKGDNLFIVFFRKGEYMECSPAVPLTGDCLEQYTNSKCIRFLSALGWI